MAPGLFWLQQRFFAVVPQYLKWNTFNSTFFSPLPCSLCLRQTFFFFSRTFTVSLHPPTPPTPFHESVSLLSCDFAVRMSNSAGILAAASVLHKEVFYSELAALCCICIHICMRSASTVHVEQSIYVHIEKFAASVIL